MKQIHVQFKDFGIFTEDDVTVQRFDVTYGGSGSDEDVSQLVWCNHAGADLIEQEMDLYNPNGADYVWTERLWVCNKCYASRRYDETDWQDAPEEGIYEA